MFETLRDELVEGKLIVIHLEGVFKESEYVFIDVNGEVGGEFVHFGVDIAECGARGVDWREACLFW